MVSGLLTKYMLDTPDNLCLLLEICSWILIIDIDTLLVITRNAVFIFIYIVS